MKIYSTFAFLLFAVKVSACSCLTQPDIKIMKDLDQYSFVALVDIVKLPPMARFGRENGSITINVKELFKGHTTTLAEDPSYNTSCGMTFNEGEQWLFFGNIANGKVSVSLCSHSRPYRWADGRREWWYDSGIATLATLRQLFKTHDQIKKSNEVFYPNGKLEIKQSFKNGSLHGNRVIYYPDGKIYITEQFKNGERLGVRKMFSVSGQLINEVVYKNGYIKTLISHHDSTYVTERLIYSAENPDPFSIRRDTNRLRISKRLDSLRKTIAWLHVSYTKTYKKDGRSYSAEYYYPTGQLKYNNYLDWDKQLYENTDRYENGKTRMYIKYDQKVDQQIEYDYKEDGSRKDFVRKCENCKYYFDATKPPQATPEPVYIQ